MEIMGTTRVPDSNVNAPAFGHKRLASPWSDRGEVHRDGSCNIGSGKDAEGTADQFWQTGAKDPIGVWTDQFLDQGDEYLDSMSSFKTNQFDPEFQLMGGLMNPTVGASSFGSFSKHEGTADVQQELYSFTGDYNNNAFEDCHHQDAFLQHVYEVFRDESEPSVEFDQPLAGMVAPYEGFHQSFQDKMDQSLKDQQIEFDLLSEPVVVYVSDANGNSTHMATAMILVKSIQGIPCSRIMKVLFDSGGSASMINSKALPRGVQVSYDHKTNIVQTLAGVMKPTGKVGVKGIRLPEFDRSLVINSHDFLIFNTECKYDMILGGDFLAKYGVNLKYETLEVEWFGNTLPMNTISFTKSQQSAFIDVYMLEVENDEWYQHGNDGIESYISAPILDAKYEKTDIDSVIKESCSHLSPNQQQELAAVLTSHEKLFDGTLGHYPHSKMQIELLPDAKPAYRRHYPVAETHKATFKKELDHLEEIGVLSRCQEPTEWCMPTFAIPKKDGRIRIVSDLRELNKYVKPVQYPLPQINEILRKRHGYKFFTKLDVSMEFDELRTFLGMVTYYREMWPRRAHVLKPLTELSGLPKKTRIDWTPERIGAFEQMKAIVAHDVLLAYPNHNKPFEIYTDASDYQLGAVLMQEGRPVAYYSRKLNPAQRNYTTMEKELLAIVETLKEYRSMLLGADITVFTDHKNLTFEKFNTQRVMRWRCFIEEYSPKLVYLEGKLNVLADAYSRMPRTESTPITVPDVTTDEKPTVLAYFLAHLPRDELSGRNPSDDVQSFAFSMDPLLSSCLINLPDDDIEPYIENYLNLPPHAAVDPAVSPLRYVWLRQAQDADQDLQHLANNNPSYSRRHFGDIELIVFNPPDPRIPWKICLTDDTLRDVIVWFHHVLGYPGKDRLKEGMHLFHHPNLHKEIMS